MVVTAVLPSTCLLTLLLLVGLFFFIKASVKDRTQQWQFLSEQDEESLIVQFQQYFSKRAYRVASVETANKQVTLEGFVRPSWFLAIFLTVLAALGILCMALVLSILLPQFKLILLGTVLLSPLAGIFYWQQAGRVEQVQLKIESIFDKNRSSQRQVTVIAHRDELMQLQQTLAIKGHE